jgi:hypothetical protein
MSIVLALLLACASDHDLARVEATDSYFQEGTDRVDILWVVDDSISMSNEQTKVAQGFQQFIAGMNMSADADFHLGIINTDMDDSNPERGLMIGDPPYLTRDDAYVAEFMARVQVGTDGSDKERGLQAAEFALSDPTALAHQEGFLRDEAVLALVFVSDENDCSDENWLSDEQDGSLCYDIHEQLVPVADYIRSYQGLKGPDGRVVVSAIVGPPVEDGCEQSWPGTRYQTVARELDGVEANICESDYLVIMDEIGARISSPQRTFFLTHPAVEDTLEVYVDDALVDPDPMEGWEYDGTLAAVSFPGDYVPAFGSVIEISYDIAVD